MILSDICVIKYYKKCIYYNIANIYLFNQILYKLNEW